MKQIFSTTLKELKSAFNSPVAWLFILLFLCVNIFSFFFIENFFGRGIADLRPFFNQMPLFLIFLAAAFTMRLWAEESQQGTLDLIQTLPIAPFKLVVGKFLAGLILLLIAILCTLPLPNMVSHIGYLDWGPVLGGYLALLFLGGSYLAMGLFASALTKSQLVSLLLTCSLGLLFLLIGKLPAYFPLPPLLEQLFLALGTGSRFNSMLRGLLDLRDIVYYLSLTAVFLALNVLTLRKKHWAKNKETHSIHRQHKVIMGLFIANIIIFNISIFPIQKGRFDLTAWQEFSVSKTTRNVLKSSQEPLLIRGYFSTKTHPLLEPLASQIKDYLTELATIGPSNLTVEFIDPSLVPEWEEEAQAHYGIRTMPFRFAAKHSDSVINAYFNILVRYGDNYEVLDFNKLVQIDTHGSEVQAGLNNLEYQLTKAIKKTVYGFSSLENVCQNLGDKVSLTLLLSHDLPAGLDRSNELVKKTLNEISQRCPATIRLDMPDLGEQKIDEVSTTYNLHPLSANTYDTKKFFYHLIVKSGSSQQVLTLTDYNSQHQLEEEILALLKRQVPGFMQKVSIIAPKNSQYAQYTGDPTYSVLQKKLSESYEVVEMELPEIKIPEDISVVIWPRPTKLNTKQAYAIDQFLMRGGTLLVGGGSYNFKPIIGEGLKVVKELSPLAPLLAHYGVASGASVILDEHNSLFPTPVSRQVGDITLNEMQLSQYPPFILVQQQGLVGNNPATGNLKMAIMPWTSPVGCQEPAPGQQTDCEAILASSAQSWEVEDFQPTPDFATYPELGFAKNELKGPFPLAVTITGSFVSFFDNEKLAQAKLDSTVNNHLSKSQRDGHLVVFGSSAFIEDIVLAITQQTTDGYLANLQLIKNLVDWSQDDPELLDISSHGSYTRLLEPLKPEAKILFEIWQFVIAISQVLALALISLFIRRRQKPYITRSMEVNCHE